MAETTGSDVILSMETLIIYIDTDPTLIEFARCVSHIPDINFIIPHWVECIQDKIEHDNTNKKAQNESNHGKDRNHGTKEEGAGRD